MSSEHIQHVQISRIALLRMLSSVVMVFSTALVAARLLFLASLPAALLLLVLLVCFLVILLVLLSFLPFVLAAFVAGMLPLAACMAMTAGLSEAGRCHPQEDAERGN